ncbi:MAG: 23S rRNA (uracil(1939)-C(5))-methyltransferase RlmD [Candidatus Hydrogenedens sp.]
MTEQTITKICPHFGICGGCEYQDIPYENQLQKKEVRIAELFKGFITTPIPIQPSPEIWHYRNKIDPVFSPEYFEKPPPKYIKRETVLGFKRYKRWYDTFQLKDCLIGPPELPNLIHALSQWRKENHYEAYDRRTGNGILHALLLRQGKRTGERMIGILTRKIDLNWNSLIDWLHQYFPYKSLYAGVYTRTAEVSQAEEWHLIDGEPHICEKLILHSVEKHLEYSFQISPSSFFQANTLSAENMFSQVYNWTKEISPLYIYDLYGGMGTFAILLSQLAREVYSVDCVSSSLEDGKKNLLLNNTSNVHFELNTVRKFLSEKIKNSNNLFAQDTLVIVDPPREGLTENVIKKLVQWGPFHLFYVSCNPDALARELPYLLEHYKCIQSKLYDFFPHTPHIETLLWLTKK